MNKRRYVLPILAVTVVLTLALAFGPALARYMESWAEDQGFWAKPMEPLTISQSWQQQDDAYAIRFTAGAEADHCRVFLAATQGVTQPQLLQVTLTVNDATTHTAVTLTGTPETIAAGSAMEGTFGPGTVFRFYDDAGREVSADLTVAGTLTVRGLEQGAEVTSLLRLFVEKA